MQIIHWHLQQKTVILRQKAGIRSTKTDFIHTELRNMIGAELALRQVGRLAQAGWPSLIGSGDA